MPSAARATDTAAPSKGAGDGADGRSESGAEHRSPDVIIDNQAALYVGDPASGWRATSGSTGVFINGRPALRRGDTTEHGAPGAGHAGEVVEGSPDVIIGDRAPGATKPETHDKSTTVHVTDGLGRPVHGVTVSKSCPHDDPAPKTVDGSTSVGGVCKSTTVKVTKKLQDGTRDPGATHGTHPQSSTRETTPSATKPSASSSPGTTKPASSSSSSSGTSKPPVEDSGGAPLTGGKTIVHAPAPSTTTSGGVTVNVPTNGGTTATTHVVLPTTHNWVQLVYEAFGQELPTGKDEVALLGVRGASLSPASAGAKPTTGSLEEDAAAGRISKVDFTTEKHVATGYSDLLFCAWTDTSVSDKQIVDVFECTIDASPGEGELHLPFLLEGVLFHATPSGFEKLPGHDIALDVFRGAKEPVAPKVPTAEDLIALAMTQRGITEMPPGSNLQKYGAWYGTNGVYWCAQFVSWCFDHIGMPLIKYEYCPTGLDEFQNGSWGTYVPPSEKAEPGDVVFYNFPEGTDATTDHTGIVVSDAGSSINTVEGNTSAPSGSGSQSNGGGVFFKNRIKSETPIVGYGRPRYPKPVEIPTSFIRWGTDSDTRDAAVIKADAGSTLLHHHYFHERDKKKVPDPAATRYRRFMEIYNKAANKKAIPYLIVSSNYVASYEDWATGLSLKPHETPKPISVMIPTGLASPEGYTQRYLPSFMSKAYADRIVKEAADTHDAKTRAKLRDALEAALFKVPRG